MTSRSPWHVAADDLRMLRGSGGQTFTEFVDALIRAEAARIGIAADQVLTNLRVNIADGGVDTEVKQPLGGLLGIAAPSCWQYKSTDFTEVTDATLVKEINSSEAAARVREGYQYCFCVCDDSTVDRQNERRVALRAAAQVLNFKAPDPLFLTAGVLAEWASQFPSVVVRFFRPQMAAVLSYDAWLRKERTLVPKYVEVPARADASKRIAEHGDFRNKRRPVMSVAGLTGTGKSRLVAEALASVAPLVLYFVDAESSLSIATWLVNEPRATALLVVDGCDAHTRAKLTQLLTGCDGRLRAVVICESSERQPDGAVAIAPLDESDLQSVLDANFERVFPSHRRAFAHLADGVIQVAASLATAYELDPSRFLFDTTADAGELLHRLVSDDQDHRALEALSLFNRVGHEGNVAAQLDAVCAVAGIERADGLRRLRRMAETQGVVTFGPRYVAIRPRLFARPLMRSAWRGWIAANVGSFVEALPADLQRAFLKQVAAHGTDEARSGLAAWALPWLRSLVPADLAKATCVERLVSLVEVSPVHVAPHLARIIGMATDLEAATPGEPLDGHTTRVHLLWCLEKLIGRRDTYALAEESMFRLAMAEGNVGAAARQPSTAVAKWASSFRIFLSGTDMPFAERVARLSSRLETSGPSAIPLVLAALNLALDRHAFKNEGAPLVAGNVRSRDWQPRTSGEYGDCFRSAIDLLGHCLEEPSRRPEAFAVLVRHGRSLLGDLMLERVQAVIGEHPLSEAERIATLGFVENFLRYDCSKDAAEGDGEAEQEQYAPEYVALVAAWKKRLQRSDVGGRLAETLGCSHSFDDESWQQDVEALGNELFAQRGELRTRLPWLGACEGNGAALVALGRSVSRQDQDGELIDAVFEVAKEARNPLFLRGYVLGLHEHHPLHDKRIAAELDRLEVFNPQQAVDLSSMVPTVGAPGGRAIRLVRAGRLRPDLLRRMVLSFEGALLAEALETMLLVFADRPEDAASHALELLRSVAWSPNTAVPTDERTLSLIWTVMETALAGAHGEAHAWGRMLRRLSENEFERTLRLACRAVIEADLSIEEEAGKELSLYIARDPRLCLEALGPMLLALKQPWMFATGRRGGVLNAFPVELLQSWIVENGVVAARLVAPHLLLPRVESPGVLVVPALTAFVLERFDTDDEVFAGFAHGRHNGQVYCGDIAGQHDAEAATAEALLTYPLRRVREWAEYESASARDSARWWRERTEEDFDD